MTQFLELAKKRYSVRAFDRKAVEAEKEDAILEAAMVAPSACNNQPVKIWAVKSAEKLAALGAVCPCLYGAPLVFVIGSDPKRAAAGKIKADYNFGETDAAIVCTHMMLEAADLGLGSCWVGWFNAAEVRTALSIAENFEIWDLLPVGYAAKGAEPSAMHVSFRPRAEMIEEL